MKTNENSFQYEHSLDHNVEFFSKAGSIFDKKDESTFYDNPTDILTLFQSSWISNKLITFKLLLWLRNCRGGAGNRSGFRRCLTWLAKRPQDYMWVNLNIRSIVTYGRYDDLRCLFNTLVEKDAVSLWNEALLNNDVLAAKWAKRTDIPLYLDLKKNSHVKNIGDFRRMLSNIRSKHIVESKMCSGEWDKIEYPHVPSVAMARYSKAFGKNDTERFAEYITSISEGKTIINASVLFPHDCVRTCQSGNSEIGNAQFDFLPDYIGDNNSIITIADTSGSMDIPVSGSITADMVSRGLALYCSNKAKGYFHKKFFQFDSESELTDWSNLSFSEAVENRDIFNGAVGCTRIDKALDHLLSVAIDNEISDNDMPKVLLICSDMQFSSGCSNNPFNSDSVVTEVERSLRKWDKSNYSRPTIVYWNLSPYFGQPDTVDSKNIALVSGFSTSILKQILVGEDVTPLGIMLRTIEDYNVIIPE